MIILKVNKKNGVQPLSEKHTFGKTTWRFKALKENMLTSETLFWDIPVLIENKVFRTKSFDKRGHIFLSQNNVSEVNMFSFEALNLHVVFPKVCFSERGWTPVFL